MLRYVICIERASDGGYGAFCPDLPGCTSGGETVEDCEANMAEAIRLHLAGLAEDGEAPPAPTVVAASSLVISVTAVA